jgi:inhibitor of cysteine peptidase
MHDLFNHRFLFFILLFAAITPCSGIELLEPHNGGNYTISQGEELVIRLPGNPTTGYLWEVFSYDSNMLRLKAESVFVADADRTGAGGQTIFQFVPCEIGPTRLKLIYRRPWEKDTLPVQVFEVVVTVMQHRKFPASGSGREHIISPYGPAE